MLKKTLSCYAKLSEPKKLERDIARFVHRRKEPVNHTANVQNSIEQLKGMHLVKDEQPSLANIERIINEELVLVRKIVALLNVILTYSERNSLPELDIAAVVNPLIAKSRECIIKYLAFVGTYLKQNPVPLKTTCEEINTILRNAEKVSKAIQIQAQIEKNPDFILLTDKMVRAYYQLRTTPADEHPALLDDLLIFLKTVKPNIGTGREKKVDMSRYKLFKELLTAMLSESIEYFDKRINPTYRKKTQILTQIMRISGIIRS